MKSYKPNKINTLRPNNYVGKIFIKTTIYLCSVPATIPVSNTYVTSAITGIYKSGEFISSLGGL